MSKKIKNKKSSQSWGWTCNKPIETSPVNLLHLANLSEQSLYNIRKTLYQLINDIVKGDTV